MPDKHSPSQRSYNMSQIRSKETKPEVLVRKYLFSQGLRFRKNDKRYPGSPDIVLSKYNAVVFVNGCFWHKHNCNYFVMPGTNIDYWKNKLFRNVERDKANYDELKKMGWRVFVVWECELRTEELREENLKNLLEKITAPE